MPQSELSTSSTKDIVIGAGVLILLATVVVVCARLLVPEPNELEMVDPPEQPYLVTGPERQFLAELRSHVEYDRERELRYLVLGRTWCRSMRDGDQAEAVVNHLGVLAGVMGLDPRNVRPTVGSATLRLCPDQSAAADDYYGGR